MESTPSPSDSSFSKMVIIIPIVAVTGFLLVAGLTCLAGCMIFKTANGRNLLMSSASAVAAAGVAVTAAVSRSPMSNTPEKTLLDRYGGPSPSASSSHLSSSDVGPQQPLGPLPAMPPSKVPLCSYEELMAATQDFAAANFLGQGGFGPVHRGVLPDGRAVAVKQLRAGGGQGEREFRAEVEIIGRVHHRHLVSLLGYCVHGEKRLLVYEFLPNSTLQFHLHGRGKPTLEWSTRLKIALGAAKGLAYLHEDCNPRIIHRDIKTANILLSENFEAKVADFGLAKLTTGADQTHVSTRVMGTPGYLAPEYASTGKLTEKSDVFSYGVMLLELITGRRPILRMQDGLVEESLVESARPLLIEALERDNYILLADQQLEQNYDFEEMRRVVACAAACVRQSAKERPKMGQVVRVLEGGVALEELNRGVAYGRNII